MTPAVFAHGQLRLYLLTLLAERPMHGYDLIQALGERFGGTYRPSAGTVYPRLAKLQDEGLITQAREGRRTIYTITDAGRDELERREPEVDGLEDDVSDSVRRLADEVRGSVEEAMRTLRADLAAAARDARDEARASGRSAKANGVSERDEGRRRLQEADAALTRFRAELRAELRSAASGVSQQTLDALTAGLDVVRLDVRRALRHPVNTGQEGR